MQSTARKLKLSMDKVVVTVDQHGNTSAASIPLALDHGVRNGQVKPGQTVLLEGVGGGFTDRKSTRLNSSHLVISYAVFCLKKKKKHETTLRYDLQLARTKLCSLMLVSLQRS